jgi:hypothetical protein
MRPVAPGNTLPEIAGAAPITGSRRKAVDKGDNDRITSFLNFVLSSKAVSP